MPCRSVLASVFTRPPVAYWNNTLYTLSFGEAAWGHCYLLMSIDDGCAVCCHPTPDEAAPEREPYL